jgi:four helix bundle suffix protein
MKSPYSFIDPHGGFRALKSFQMSEIVFDGTVRFCDHWIGRRSRTHDQMVQAARSGKQNIAEGSMASGTSKKIELKLLDRQLRQLEQQFLEEGGFTEKLYRTRMRAWRQ